MKLAKEKHSYNDIPQRCYKNILLTGNRYKIS